MIVANSNSKGNGDVRKDMNNLNRGHLDFDLSASQYLDSNVTLNYKLDFVTNRIKYLFFEAIEEYEN